VLLQGAHRACYPCRREIHVTCSECEASKVYDVYEDSHGMDLINVWFGKRDWIQPIMGFDSLPNVSCHVNSSLTLTGSVSIPVHTFVAFHPGADGA
jgi:hypothetical protein